MQRTYSQDGCSKDEAFYYLLILISINDYGYAEKG